MIWTVLNSFETLPRLCGSATQRKRRVTHRFACYKPPPPVSSPPRVFCGVTRRFPTREHCHTTRGTRVRLEKQPWTLLLRLAGCRLTRPNWPRYTLAASAPPLGGQARDLLDLLEGSRTRQDRWLAWLMLLPPPPLRGRLAAASCGARAVVFAIFGAKKD